MLDRSRSEERVSGISNTAEAWAVHANGLANVVQGRLSRNQSEDVVTLDDIMTNICPDVWESVAGVLEGVL